MPVAIYDPERMQSMNGDRMLSVAWWGGVVPVVAALDPRNLEDGSTQKLLFLAGVEIGRAHV